MKIPTWREEFSKKDKILGWEGKVPERPMVKKIPEIVIPATLSSKQRKRMKERFMGERVTENERRLNSNESKCKL